MKKCNRCHVDKNLSEFHNMKKSHDGKAFTCKECMKSYVKEKYKENTKEKIEYGKKYYRENKEERLAYHKKYQSDNAERCNEYQSKYRKTNIGRIVSRKATVGWGERNKEKLRAHISIRLALDKGAILKSEVCELCGQNKKRIIGHHYDYSKQLDVVWCCDKCHKKIHM